MDSAAQTTTMSGRVPEKTFKVRENNVFTPIPQVPPPAIAKGLFSLPHPDFEPLKRVPFDSMHVLVPICSALQLFLLLLGEVSLATTVAATSTDAQNTWHNDASRRTRPWRQKPAEMRVLEKLSYAGEVFRRL